ncbi:MAG: cytochrome-c peroxidase [Bacteroidia bacterium]|nr:cytochrome-c peroxidase [Bacteroidia bacterium]MCF8427865.1 cytochrome-c peroxidase [Bacteroidia bacterium]MCF8446614.1 cytochrome-c peroxidase [Bacteroidia bacterium]
MRKSKLLILFLLGMFFLAFQVVERALFSVPKNWPKPAYDFKKNPLSKEKILLGRVLFYDPILSQDNSISCASCHSVYTAFTHVDHNLSHGINDRIGTRNSPALMNLAWHKNFMWDGAINHLDMQALAPISHPDEMGENIQQVVEKLNASTLYKQLFFAAYQDSLATGENTLKAISQFMLTLVSSNSKYDSVMRGTSKFTEQEKSGYVLFKKNCSACHAEPLFTNLEFRNNGLPIDTNLKDFGRMRITQNASDSLKFKVPTLRNLEFSYPYMHDGRFKKLKDVLYHYTHLVQTEPNLDKELKTPIQLDSKQQTDLTAFLLTLTDKSFLFNKDFAYPREILKSN